MTLLYVALTSLFLFASALDLLDKCLNHIQPDNILATVCVLIYITTQPIIANLASTLGRRPCFFMSIVMFVIALILYATKQDAPGKIFHILSLSSLFILCLIYVSDITVLKNRALALVLLDISHAWTWTASPRLSMLMDHSRSSYGVFTLTAILLLPLFLLREGKVARRRFDIIGLALLTGALICILLPLVVSYGFATIFDTPWKIATLTSSVIFVVAFGIWTTFASAPFFNRLLFQDRTIICGYMIHLISSVAYHYWHDSVSALLSASGGFREDTAYIPVYTVASVISGIIAGIAMKISRHYKWIVVVGTIVSVIADALLIYFRNQDIGAAIIASQAVAGIGSGLKTLPLLVGIQGLCTPEDVTSATAMYLLFGTVGNIIGKNIANTKELYVMKLAQTIQPASHFLCGLACALSVLTLPLVFGLVDYDLEVKTADSDEGCM